MVKKKDEMSFEEAAKILPGLAMKVMAEKKDTNPKDAVGVKKVGISVLSFAVLFELALAVFEGARKYGKFNWRKVGVRSSVYIDACFRHIASWQEGENIDPESGISHLVKAEACLHILRDAQIRGMMTDDRPPGTIGFVAVQNGMARDLIERHPVAEEPITHKDAPAVDYFNGEPQYDSSPYPHNSCTCGNANCPDPCRPTPTDDEIFYGNIINDLGYNPS